MFNIHFFLPISDFPVTLNFRLRYQPIQICVFSQKETNCQVLYCCRLLVGQGKIAGLKIYSIVMPIILDIPKINIISESP